MYRRVIAVAALMALAISVGGCSRHPNAKPQSLIDQPAYHIKAGFERMDMSDWPGAADAFQKAISLDQKNRIALACRGLCLLQTTGGKEEAKKLLKRADDPDNPAAYPLLLEAYLKMPDNIVQSAIKKSLRDEAEDVEKVLARATKLAPQDQRVTLWAARAEEALLRFDPAKALLTPLTQTGSYQSEADRRLKIIADVERLAPQSDFGKALGLLNHVTRAEAAAMISLEIQPARYLDKSDAAVLARDVRGHWAELFISEVVTTGVFENGTPAAFRPDEPFSRVDFALAYQRLVIALSKDKSWASRFTDSKSGYQDLSSAHPAYNAARLTVDEGLLTAPEGKFAPNGAITGVNLLEMINLLQKNYRRF